MRTLNFISGAKAPFPIALYAALKRCSTQKPSCSKSRSLHFAVALLREATAPVGMTNPCKSKHPQYLKTQISLLGGGAAYDFDDFFCDFGLAGAVHYKGQAFDHVGCVVGGRVHGGHAGGVFGGHGL